MTLRAGQSGATLVIVLVMLVMITLFVVSMVRLSNTNLKVVGNMQTQRALETSAQEAIENSISSITFFNDAIGSTGTWPAGTTSVNAVVNGYSIAINRPVCLYSQVAEGYSATSAVAPEDTQWEVAATSTDPITGATVQMAQGLKMRLTANSCP